MFKRGNVTNYLDYYKDITETEGWPFFNNMAEKVYSCTEEKMAYGGIKCTYKVEENLEVVEIIFDTTTFDKITRDAKTNFVTKISTIGGTLGLFSGFSILSGVEIVYFISKIVLLLFKNSKNIKKQSYS